MLLIMATGKVYLLLVKEIMSSLTSAENFLSKS